MSKTENTLVQVKSAVRETYFFPDAGINREQEKVC